MCQIRSLKRFSGRIALELDPGGTNDLELEEVRYEIYGPQTALN